MPSQSSPCAPIKVHVAFLPGCCNQVSQEQSTKLVKFAGLIGAIIGVIFTPLAVVISLKGAQHGDYYWAGVFYPLLTLLLFKGGGLVVALLALLQYPLFGWYTGRCVAREHYIRIAVVLCSLQIFPMLLGMFN